MDRKKVQDTDISKEANTAFKKFTLKKQGFENVKSSSRGYF
jgi:hypothetical protein